MRFLPSNQKLFELFENHARLVMQASDLLLEGVNKGGPYLKIAAVRIAQIEQEADDLVHMVYSSLNSTFITPLDPEDIQALGSRLDDVLDGIEDTSYRISAYHLDSIPENAIRFCTIIHDCSKLLAQAVSALTTGKDTQPFCVEIHTLENDADELARNSIEGLLNGNGDPITTIKLKEIYDFLEETVDRCEDVADTLGNIVLKNA